MNDPVLVRPDPPQRRAAPRTLSLLAAALLLAPTPAAANPDGRQINRASVGCGAVGNCHGNTAGATATLTGPAMARAGARSTYVLTIHSTLAGFTGGGFDIAAHGPAGTALAVNPTQANTRLNGVDLVMNSRFAAAAGAVTVTFDLVTPTAGAVTLNAAGNATNGTGSAGDAWALAALGVTVAAAPLTDAGTPADVGTVADAGPRADVGTVTVPDGGIAGDTGLEAYDPTASYGYGGCSVGAREVPASALRWAWVLALGYIARRRRGGDHA